MAYAHDLVNYIFDLENKINPDPSKHISLYATVASPKKFYIGKTNLNLGWREWDKVTDIAEVCDPNYIYFFPGDTYTFSFGGHIILGSKIFLKTDLGSYGFKHSQGLLELNSFDELILAPENLMGLLPQPEEWFKFRNLPPYEARQLYELGYINSNQNINNDFNNPQNNNQLMNKQQPNNNFPQEDILNYTPFTDNKTNEMESTAIIERLENPLLPAKPITPKTVIKTGDTLIKTDTGSVSNPPPKKTNKTKLLIGAGILFAAIKLLKK